MIESKVGDRLYSWYALFGIAGSNNDLMVLYASPLVGMIENGNYPLLCEYSVMGTVRKKPYWLTDGINPKYPCFLHSIIKPSI